jgi:zinc transporter
MNDGNEFSDLLPLGTASDETAQTLDEFCRNGPQSSSYWIHFSADQPILRDWLQTKAGVDKLLADAMLSQKVRPRLVTQKESLLLILRVADTLEASDHEELRSLRIYVDADRIISTSLYPLPVVQELMRAWKGKDGKGVNAIDLFMDLIKKSVRGLEGILEGLEDQTDLFEKKVLDVGEDPSEGDLASLALDSLHIRRYLAPQREVLSRLQGCEVSWLVSAKKKRVREVYERVCRQLDEVEVLRDRAKIIRDEMNSHVAEQVNHRLYVFSVIAVVFVPLGFLTGLLGVNLGGIPGAESPIGFLSFCSILTAIASVMILTFKRIKWL